jgi:3-oxoadipate enol-lactonase
MESPTQGIFETSDGCPIAYTLRPAARPDAFKIVLIHSLAMDESIWDQVVAELAGNADVLTYDCRGHGRSGRQAALFTPELFARDLAEMLDHIGWPAAAVAGCSMGGCVAQAFGAAYPARAAALGLIDTTAWFGEDAPVKWRERAGVARSQGLASMVDFQVARWFGDHFRNTQPDLVSAATKVFLANDLDCYAASCVLLGDADLRPCLSSLRLPVAIIVGEEDYATPVTQSQQLHEAIQDSTLTILRGARHLTPMECPEQIAAELLALLRRIESGPARPQQAELEQAKPQRTKPQQTKPQRTTPGSAGR